MHPFKQPYLHVLRIATAALAGLVQPTFALPESGSACGTSCGTTVLAGTYVNETWSLAGSPYCITDSITLANVTILPGVCVRVSTGASITVGVNLVAIGTQAQPITFTAADPVLGWSGIVFNSTAPGSILEHCCIEDTATSGLRITNAAPVIKDCVIQRCGRNGLGGTTAGPTSGGGMNINLTGNGTAGSAQLVLQRTHIRDCFAITNGGGLHAVLNAGAVLALESCVLDRNTAHRSDTSAGVSNSYGGAASLTSSSTGNSFTANKSLFRSNRVHSLSSTSCGSSCTAWGGALSFTNVNAHFETCVLSGNVASALENSSFGCSGEQARAYGGAIWFDSAGRTFDLFNCILGGNTSTGGGSSQLFHGAGIYLNNGVGSIVNTTIARNNTHAIYKGASAPTPTVSNSILYFNNAGGAQTSGTMSFDYSCVQAASPVCATCINVDPTFWGTSPPASSNAAALRIVPFSPCVDAGDPALPHTDCGLYPAQGGARNDMGAHGGPGACGWRDVEVLAHFCTATVNSTGQAAQIGWSGTSSCTANDLVLVATQLPPNTPGLFFFGVSHVQQIFGNGYRCVTGNVVRLPPAYANASGVATQWLDRNSIPQLAPLVPGEVRSFQYWYRNPVAPPAGFNLSDGLEVYFRL